MTIFTVYTASILFAVGFTGRVEAAQTIGRHEQSAFTEGNRSITMAAEVIPGQALEATKEEVKEAQKEARRKAEEEARRAAEEAARREAEAAAREEELQLLASIIFCEAGNQPYEGQVAVGAVVMNRVKSGVYPNTIAEVIYQQGQFGPAMTGWLDSVRASAGYTPAAMQAAKDALAGVNPVGGCLYFGNGNSGMQIGDHFFY